MIATRVLRLDSTGSTNADAMRLARDGESGPLWIVAREQIEGRGRRGRVWHSPPGNLYASLLLVGPCPADVAPQIGFVAGVALVEALDCVLGVDAPVQLKWPNDVLCDDAKLAGILSEASRLADGALVCAVGIGINCRLHPDDLPYRATHLSQIAGRAIEPEEVFPLLDHAMSAWLARWNAGQNFAAVRHAWLARAVGRGREIEIIQHGGTIRGRFESIDAIGRLIVVTDDGHLSVDAGDVRLTPTAFAPTPADAA